MHCGIKWDKIDINVSLMYEDNLTLIDLIDRIRTGYKEGGKGGVLESEYQLNLS